jgi:hypothetical protein
MIRVTLLSLAMVGASAAVSPVAAGQTVIGAGVTSCGEWLRLRAFEGHEGHFQELASVYQLEAWIDGFVSGVNVTDEAGPDLLTSKPGGAALYAWIDNYCRSKPLDPVVTSVFALIKELRSRAERK